MTLYAPANIPGVHFSREVGGCGAEHVKGKRDERLSVACTPCENLIREHLAGWGSTPSAATRTEAEQLQAEADQREADQLMRASGQALGALVMEQAEKAKRTRKAS